MASASYIVDDEYGQASSSGAVAVAADGSYGFTIQLPASRLGTDKDGCVASLKLPAPSNDVVCHGRMAVVEMLGLAIQLIVSVTCTFVVTWP